MAAARGEASHYSFARGERWGVRHDPRDAVSSAKARMPGDVWPEFKARAATCQFEQRRLKAIRDESGLLGVFAT
jgi:hypothetical protein